ncbi:MAG: ribose 5-phosphate isomerase A, partial [Pseudomonadota bacterium]
LDEAQLPINLVGPIKGGGGSLLREKIVAHIAARFIVIADAQKQVDILGRFPLPVEIVTFGWKATQAAVAKATGTEPALRHADGAPLVTDNSNYIVDCPLGRIEDPEGLSAMLLSIPGVVEHGLFLGEADMALIGTEGRVDRILRAG